MTSLHDIAPFPNPCVRLIKEDEYIAVWVEVFEPGTPTPPHHHMRDYIARFPHGGELTIVPVVGEAETYTMIAGEIQEADTAEKGVRITIPAGTMIHSGVPEDGIGHFAVNEGPQPRLMILTEIKGTATEKRGK